MQPHRLILASLVTAGLAVPAHAQPLLQPPTPAPAELHRTPKLAGALALGATVGAYVMISAGISIHSGGTGGDAERGAILAWSGVGLAMVGPAAGHVYAGEYGHALATTAIRIGGLALPIWPVLGGGEPNDGLIAAGAVVVVAATLYDLVDAPRAARRANRRHAIQLAPAPIASRQGVAPGLAISGSF